MKLGLMEESMLEVRGSRAMTWQTFLQFLDGLKQAPRQPNLVVLLWMDDNYTQSKCDSSLFTQSQGLTAILVYVDVGQEMIWKP